MVKVAGERAVVKVQEKGSYYIQVMSEGRDFASKPALIHTDSYRFERIADQSVKYIRRIDQLDFPPDEFVFFSSKNKKQLELYWNIYENSVSEIILKVFKGDKNVLSKKISKDVYTFSGKFGLGEYRWWLEYKYTLLEDEIEKTISAQTSIRNFQVLDGKQAINLQKKLSKIELPSHVYLEDGL